LRAAAIKVSISDPVRYSRVLATEEFTMVGASPLADRKAMIIPSVRIKLPSLEKRSYLGHKDIRHTVRYTELSPMRFKGLWKD
jgi:hypothetical protein